MLGTVQRIIQEVYTATNLDEALGIVVRRVKKAMGVDSCSVLIADGPKGDYVLMATEGLNPESVGKVRLRRNEGLVGLVGERREPINLEDAAKHPRYRYFPETGEERYHGFLGVPIIHYRRVLGVLIVYQREARRFDKNEEALLVTLAAQLAGAINDGIAGGGISRLRSERKPPSGFIQGIPGAPGLSIGTVVLPSPFANLTSVPDRKVDDVEAEETVFRTAVAAVQAELRASAERMAELLPAEAQALFDVYLMLLERDGLIADAVERIRAGNWAPGALRDTIAHYAHLFEQMGDSYLRARAEDIRSLGQRILAHLQTDVQGPGGYPDRCVLVGEEIGAALLADVPIDKLAGLVCMRGSVLSHTAILARALGIPAVMGIGDLPLAHLEGAAIVVDGYQGHVFLDPSPSVLVEFERLVGAEQELLTELETLRDQSAVTLDGIRIPLFANSGLLSDVQPALDRGAEGIGLFRTEFTFMVHDWFPSEDQQFQIYRKVLASFVPRPVTIRTLDAGGDKGLPYFPVTEDNALLGWRGIRVSLDHPEIFLSQLRALLRANAGLNNLQLVFPMISRITEVDQARELLERAYRELLEEGQPAAMPPLGVVVEVPAAVYQIGKLARKVDFLSIGTNDLTQYLLAVDRNNARVSLLYDGLHPAVLLAVHQVIQGAHRCGKPVGVCGEMAGDPAAVILLLGMEIDTLSVPAPSLLRIKWVIRNFTRRQAAELLDTALEMSDSVEVRALLNEVLRETGLGALVRTGD